jgi:hypothetical protein
MPVNGKSRRSYRGAPVSNTLGVTLNAAATGITLTAAMSGWSTDSEPFFVVVDPGTAKEEKICVKYTSATTLTVVNPADTSTWGASASGRGADGTTDRQHEQGAVIYPVFTALEANQANELVSKYANAGSVVYQGSGTPGTFTELAVGTAAQVLKVNAGATAPEWGQVVTAGIADSAVTSAKIADGTIVNADINASAAIALSKLATGALPTAITVASANIVNDSIVDADINSAAAISLSKLATGALPTAITVASANLVDGTIVNADVNASAAIALSKLATGALPTAITVASANIVDGTIVAADIADGAVDKAKIGSGPRGIVAFGQNTTNIGFGGETTIVTASAFTAVASRYYKITFFQPSMSNTAAGVALMKIKNGATVLNTCRASQFDADTGGYEGSCIAVATFTAGSVTLTGTIQSSNLGSTNCSSTQYGFILVEDIGIL